MSDLQGHLFAVADVADGAVEQVAPAPELLPEDAAVRAAAIDTSRSILVQAPAGAGKTGLLTQRFLALLSEVEEPEQILAITFTRAATAEMRGRILGALERAQGQPDAQPGEDEALPLARRALAHSERLGWRLLEQPHRLDVQTIDSLCLRLAHGQPLLARLGGALAPLEDADALYATAARRTVAQLGRGRDSALEDALATLLLRRDNDLLEVERLLARMLARRDAWLSALPLRFDADVDWDAVRQSLEEPFARENRTVLTQLCETAGRWPEIATELSALGRYAGSHADREVEPCTEGKPDPRLLAQLSRLPGPDQRGHWLALADLLLTGKDEWRKSWTVTNGFPAPGNGPGREERRDWKDRMGRCSEQLQAHALGAQLQALLCRVRSLPAPRYSDDQWQTLMAVLRVLRRAAAELRLLFAENNAVDFVEIAQSAQAVLEDEASMRGLLESERKQHLLIDEFQDTSRSQYRLVAELLREWQPGDGRSVFVVGDPLQSIYSFRQAEVALFHEARTQGLPCGEDRRHPCHTLQLTHNFRSHAELVGQMNDRFHRVFASSGMDTFVPANAFWQPQTQPSFQLHPCFVDCEEQGEPAREEAAQVVQVLQAELPQVAAAQARGDKEYRVAVLVRSRTHLATILPALRAAGLAYRAVELEPLADRPEVHDLLMLLRALLHPADRVAWLTVLRAPWCGLLLADLHRLSGEDDPAVQRRAVPELIEARAGLLSPDGQARLGRTWKVLQAALQTRYSEGNHLSLAAWVERAWMALDGPACLGPDARENAEAFLQLLDDLQPSGVEVLRGDFAARLAKLCAAPDPSVSERFGVQVMTIHKSKGLGFEVVLLPGLHRKPRADGTELVAMLQRNRAEDETDARNSAEVGMELLLAPIGSREDPEQDRTYRWVMAERRKRDADERKRLFYVACTRARVRLHLFATAEVKDGQLRRPDECSLLQAAWPALEEELAARLPAAGLQLAASGYAAEAAPATAKQATIVRLPSDWTPQPGPADVAWANPSGGRKALFTRTEGSLAARARGTAMHALLERLTLLAAGNSRAGALHASRSTLENLAVRILREHAVSPAGMSATARELAGQALAAATSDMGWWLLKPHPGALAESTWQVWDRDEALRTLRVDRSFIAGEQAGQDGESCQWIVDYKTGAPAGQLTDPGDRAAWLAGQQEKWRAQLEAYGTAFGNARPLRYGLFFPELLEFLSWNESEPG